MTSMSNGRPNSETATSETTLSASSTQTGSLIPAGEARPCDPESLVTYSLTALADPGTLPRALELLAKRGLVPLSLTAERKGDELVLTMAMDGLAQAESEHIARCLAMIPMVTGVTTSAERTRERLRGDSDLSRAAA